MVCRQELPERGPRVAPLIADGLVDGSGRSVGGWCCPGAGASSTGNGGGRALLP